MGKLLGLIRTITVSLCPLESFMMLYNGLVRSKLEYGSVVWNSLTTIDSNKLESMQKMLLPCVKIDSLKIIMHTITTMLWIKLHIFYERRRILMCCPYGTTLTTHPHLVPRLSMSRSYTSSPPMRLHGT
jgi:hypothetical protein